MLKSDQWSVKYKIKIVKHSLYLFRSRVLSILWARKRDRNIGENWLMGSIMTRKLRCFIHVKCHSGLERTMMEGVIPGKRVRGRPMRRWRHSIEDILCMEIHDAGILVNQYEVPEPVDGLLGRRWRERRSVKCVLHEEDREYTNVLVLDKWLFLVLTHAA